jgi:hypothetical protein
MNKPFTITAGVAILAVSALAHHSAAMFDSSKLVVLKGSVITWTLMNPHAWISVDARVNGAGKSVRWDVEATSPRQLAGIGITHGTVKPGDKVTIGIRPLKDGRAGGSMVFLITPDGVVHGAKPEDLGLSLESLTPGP